jgi:hypothetical protein
MVMVSNTSRRSDDRPDPHQGPFQAPLEGPFAGLGDDGASHGLHSDQGDQGEVVVLPFQFVVSPDYGRFHPASLPPATNGTLMLAAGTLIGEVRNGPNRQQVHSHFAGPLDVWLVTAGQIVIPGQPVCSLRSTHSTHSTHNSHGSRSATTLRVDGPGGES